MLETKIEALTTAINTWIAMAQSMPPLAIQPAAPAPAAFVPPPSPQPLPVPAFAMPAPPTFVTPAPVAAPAGAPFTDAKGLIDYVMSAYKTMGPTKGAQIQGVLSGLGCPNINDVTPDKYNALFAGVEALK